MKKPIIPIIAVVVIIGIAVFLFVNLSKSPQPNPQVTSTISSISQQTNTLNTASYATVSYTTVDYKQNTSGNNQNTNLKTCGTNYTLFSYPLFNTSKILYLLPVGGYIPPDHTFPAPHAYVYTNNRATGQDLGGAYLYAPGNMVLTQLAIRNLSNTYGVYRNVTDYTLVFSPCKEFNLYFHNVVSLQYTPILNASQNLAKTCHFNKTHTFCQTDTNIPISAGQIIGVIGNKSIGIGGVDVGARDYRLQTGRNFIDPNKLCYGDLNNHDVYDRCYTVCPYDYFIPSIRSQLHFSNAAGTLKTTQPTCGTVYQDVNGTAKGYWFSRNASSTISPEATYLFLGDDDILPMQVFSVGITISGFPSGKYIFSPTFSGMINSNFSSITPSSNVYCYSANLASNSANTLGPNFIILLRLVSSTTLQIGHQNGTSCGSGPWNFTASTAFFYR